MGLTIDQVINNGNHYNYFQIYDLMKKYYLYGYKKRQQSCDV